MTRVIQSKTVDEKKDHLLNSPSSSSPPPTNSKREQWNKKIEFILACIGYSVGLGNVWRFPYLCYESGGGAFLIPFFIMLFLCAVPLLYMELAVGQYTRRGPIQAMGMICPMLKGSGVATVVISFFLCTYYNVIMTWDLFYMVNTFRSELPWFHCRENDSQHCMESIITNSSMNSSTNSSFRAAGVRSPSEDYFINRVLERSDGLEHPGGIRWELFGLLLLAWILVYLCIFKGVRVTGKIVYFTALFPYVVLFILLIRGCTLPGASLGIDYFIKPRWELLLQPTVWVNAAAQNFNSIGIAFGSLIAMSSYNKFNNSIVKDVLSVFVADAFTSIIAGFAIFSVLGHIAFTQNKAVTDVVTDGPGLVFVVYPEVFRSMPVPQLWAFLFFFMILCLGIDSQFAMVDVVITTIQDSFGPLVKKYLKRKEILVAIVCVISFLCGLPNISRGGIYFFKMIDKFAAGVSLMYIAFFEVIAIVWIYGAGRLADNVEEMTGARPHRIIIICWYVVSPLLILAIWIFSMIQYVPVTYGEYTYPDWGQALGWVIGLISIGAIPLCAVHAVYKAKGTTFFEKIKTSLRSTLTSDHAIVVRRQLAEEEQQALQEAQKQQEADADADDEQPTVLITRL